MMRYYAVPVLVVTCAFANAPISPAQTTSASATHAIINSVSQRAGDRAVEKSDSQKSTDPSGKNSGEARSNDAAANHSQGPIKRFAIRLLSDEKAIWSSPMKLAPSDLKWLAPLAATTAVLFATDRRAVQQIDSSSQLARTSRSIANLASPQVTFGTAAGFYVIGSLSHNKRAKETGL